MKVLDNHRGRQERRQSGAALATGCFDRRHIAERRLPEMTVLKLSERDWQIYFGASTKRSKKLEQ
jgi:hypothetical protein